MSTNPIWIVGNEVWAPDPERVYVRARVTASGGGKVQVDAFDGSFAGKQVKPDELLPRSIDQRVVCNMDNLGELHLAAVLNNVEALFGQPVASNPGQGFASIYSSVGPMLIAMNPFKELSIYGRDWMDAYKAASGNENRNQELGPHCYQTVEEAFHRLAEVRQQSVVICGESGAGKTVTNRKMIDYLCMMAKPPASTGKDAVVGADPEAITQANILLESFGNAKTTRNENSSRFGKYSRMVFLPKYGYQLSGCQIEHYLLERSRVTFHEPTERNYHIFYQLLKSGKGKEYKIGDDVEAFNFTKNSADIKGQDDAEDFHELWKGMSKAGFGDDTRSDVMKVVAAVLHIGNIDFVGDAKEKCEVSLKHPSLVAACELLECDPGNFAKAMVHQVITVAGGEAPIWKPLGTEMANSQRDAVAKTLYSRMFDQIVTFLGKALNKASVGRGSVAPNNVEAVIGLLDIFGFEDMTVNGFEQMFINLTNERIQHLFNQIVFDREMEAYRKEGVSASFDPGDGNLQTVKLFTSRAKPTGIVKLLSESAMMKGGRDGEAFVTLLNKSFSKHASFNVCDPKAVQQVAKDKKLKRGALDYRECFQIKHFAGLVTYTVKNWVPKSMDSLPNHVSEVLASSKSGYVAELFEHNDEMGRATVGEKFCTQLESLSSTLESGGALFVRCIKSNPEKLPGLVNRKLVLEQLVNGGVISALWMRHQGLPDRVDYNIFCQEFGILTRDNKGSPEFMAKAILRDIFGEDALLAGEFAYGHTKVFMKTRIHSLLRSLVGLRWNNVAKKVQRRWNLRMLTYKIKKIQKSWEEFQDLQKEVEERGLAGFPLIAQTLFDGMMKINPAVQKLEELTAKFGSAVEKIAKGLDKELASSAKRGVDAARATLDKVLEMKSEADQVFGMRILNAMSALQAFKSKTEKTLAECTELADAVKEEDLKQVLAAGNTALAKISKAIEKDMVEIRDKGIRDKFVETEGKLPLNEKEISPELNAVMEVVEKAVAPFEELANEVFKVRIVFQKAVEEVLPMQQESERVLEALNSEARRYIAEGFEEVAQKVSAAWEFLQQAQAALDASKDADKYKEAVLAFGKSVQEVQAIVESSKAELQRREAERHARLELQDTLNHLESSIQATRKDVQTTLVTQLADERGTQAIATLDGLSEEISQANHSAEELKVWRGKVEKLQQKVSKSLQEISGLAKSVQKERREAFTKRMGMFNKGAPEKKEKELLLAPYDFLKGEGMEAHEDFLIEISDAIISLRHSGCTRAALKRCLDHFLKYGYSDQVEGAVSKIVTTASFGQID